MDFKHIVHLFFLKLKDFDDHKERKKILHRGIYLVIILVFIGAVFFTFWTTQQNAGSPVKRGLSLIDPSQIQLSRKLQLQRTCSLKLMEDNSTTAEVPNFIEAPLISTKYNYMYCPVEGAASSLMTKILYMLERGLIPAQFPVWMKNKQVKEDSMEILASLGSKADQLRFLQSATKIVFGVNPYQRIFHAYILNLLIINREFEKFFDIKINTEEKWYCEKRCKLKSMTFQEFLDTVTSQLVDTTDYFRPIVDKCRMCHIKSYDIIGKMETFEDDLRRFESTLFNVSFTFLNNKAIPGASEVSAVKELVEKALGDSEDNAQHCDCLTEQEKKQRLWCALEILNLRSDSWQVGSNIDVNNVSREDIANVVSKLRLRSKTVENESLQHKNQSLRFAFARISRESIVKLRDVYEEDFDVFGYDSNPDQFYQKDDDFTHVPVCFKKYFTQENK